ncbi:MAG: MFS transporter [Firmicutes bacterium]|nr:MFS transporter [Bacillota bacterium]
MNKRQLVHIAVLAAVPFVMVLGNSMLIPVFPQLRQAMDLTSFQVGLLVTAFSVPAAIVIPAAGVLSDHIGRRKVIGPALIVYGAGGLIAGLAAVLVSEPYPVVLAGRIVQGVGAGGTYLLAVALAGDIFRTGGRTQVLGILEAANGLGKVTSPILGALVGLISWWAPFFVYGLLAIPAALGVWFLVDEPPLEKGRGLREYGRALKRIFRERGGTLCATYGVGMTVLFVLFGALSFVADELPRRYGISGLASGLVLALPVGTMAVTAYVAGTYFQHRMAMLKPVIVGGTALAAASLGVSALWESLVPFIAALSVLGIGIGSVLPAINTLVTSAADRTERGLVTSLYGAVRFAGVALGPPAFAMALELGRAAMLVGAAALAAAALALGWWAIKPGVLLEAQKADRPVGERPAGDGQDREGTRPALRELERKG